MKKISKEDRLKINEHKFEQHQEWMRTPSVAANVAHFGKPLGPEPATPWLPKREKTKKKHGYTPITDIREKITRGAEKRVRYNPEFQSEVLHDLGEIKRTGENKKVPLMEFCSAKHRISIANLSRWKQKADEIHKKAGITNAQMLLGMKARRLANACRITAFREVGQDLKTLTESLKQELESDVWCEENK